MRVNSVKLNNYYKIPKNNKVDNKKDRYGTPPYIDDTKNSNKDIFYNIKKSKQY